MFSILEEIDNPSTVEAIRYFHNSTRPVLLGHLSLHLGLSLERTQLIVDDLVVRNIVRHATTRELITIDVSSKASAYVLIDPPELNIAFRG